MSIWDGVPVIGPAIGAISSAFGQASANRANREIASSANIANAQQAREQMAFQERMANTAYQRQMADLKAAGVNPMLVASLGGSSTPPGASIPAQQAAAQQNIASGIGQGASSAIDAIRTRYEIQNMKEANEKIRSDTELNKALRLSANADARLKANSARIAAANAKITESNIPGAEFEGKIDSSLYGKAVRAINRINPFAGTAKGIYSVVKKAIPRGHGTYNKKTGEIHP
jgi:hypothetical protein